MVSVIELAVFKIFYKFFSMQNLSAISKIMQLVQCDLTFIFIKLSERNNSFVNKWLAFEIINVAIFMKTRFY